MELSQQRFDRLVNLIYDTLDDRRAWRTVLACLNEALGTRAVHLLAFDARHGALSFKDGANVAPDSDTLYLQKYQFVDPRLALVRKSRPGEWVHCHEHFDDAFVAHDPCFQEFAIPHGSRYVSACKVLESDTATVILACDNDAASGPLHADAIAFVDRLLPHVSRACRLGVAHFVYSAQGLVGHALADRLAQPVMLVTTAGDAVLVNDAATRLLAATSLLRIDSGRLVLPERYRKDFFDRCGALERTARAASAAAEPGFCVLHLASEAGAAADKLYGFFTMLLPERVMGSFGLRPLVMLLLYRPGAGEVIDAALLADAFGLSQAECRVAGLLAAGVPLKTIADTLGVQYDTVRKQLMSIYQKTSTNRQPDLVRLLLHLSAAPAAGRSGAARLN